MVLGYNRILNKNKIILLPFFDYSNPTPTNDYLKKMPIVGVFYQKLASYITRKKIDWIKSRYPECSAFLSEILSHKAKYRDVLRLYDSGVPLIDDFILCLKNEHYICPEALGYLKEFENNKIGSRWSASCSILEIYLSCFLNRFQKDKEGCTAIVYGYCFGVLDRDKALLEINKMDFKIPQTTQLIKNDEHSYEKLEKVFVKELNI